MANDSPVPKRIGKTLTALIKQTHANVRAFDAEVDPDEDDYEYDRDEVWGELLTGLSRKEMMAILNESPWLLDVNMPPIGHENMDYDDLSAAGDLVEATMVWHAKETFVP